MTDKKEEVQIVESENIQDPKYIDSYKIAYCEGAFEISFGRSIPQADNSTAVKVESKIIISDFKLPELIFDLFSASQQ
jgi:hypothetical protein